jgi:anti-sigma factor ChrR (cupin superfamily)
MMNGFALALDELRALALSPKLAWRHFAPGVQIYRLWGAANGRSGALLRYAAGSKIARHRHEGTENIYVLIGAQRDDRGDYEVGAHVVNDPGSVHTVSSPTGCVVFVVWERPNTFIDEPR